MVVDGLVKKIEGCGGGGEGYCYKASGHIGGVGVCFVDSG